MQVILNQIDRAMSAVLGNQYVSSALILFLVLYSSLAAPMLPPFIASLFESTLFKLLILFLILVVFNYDAKVALLIAVGFVLSLQALNRYHLFGMATDLGDQLQSKLVGAEGEDSGVFAEQVESHQGCDMVGGCGCAGTVGDEIVEPMTFTGQKESEDSSKPQPQSVDLVLPPQPAVPTEVATVMNRDCQFMGPQGMGSPQGYSGTVFGANFGTCDAEL